MFGLVYSPWERVTTSYHFEKVVCANTRGGGSKEISTTY